MKVTLVRGYNLESLWLCLLQNKVEELNQRLRHVIDGNSLLFFLDYYGLAAMVYECCLKMIC